MQNLESRLKTKLSSATHIVILGVGSELRGDDAAGIAVAKKIQKSLKTRQIRIPTDVLIGETAPENFTGEIKKIRPSHLIIIDSANIMQNAGSIALLDHNDVGGFTFCSHMLPIRVMVEYLLKSFEFEIIIIGIQPKTLEHLNTISEEIKKSINLVCKAIMNIIM